jgi:cytochrome d ubiquinol oxidase subunit II
VSTVAAIILFIAIVGYSIFGGADFGAGFWDLTAGGAQRGEQPREVIDHSIGPVWEANHVWLIFVLVVLWTCFPEAFASITVTLFVPLTVAALGILVRGSSFAFRHALLSTRDRRAFGALFAISSLIVPFCFGTIVGSIVSGRVPDGGEAGDPVASWINPTSIVVGVMAVSAVAFLAATYLVWDARRLANDDMVEYFRRRAVAAGVATGIVAIIGLVVLADEAEYVFDGLTSRGLVFVIASGLGGIATLVLLMRHRHSGARLTAVVAVASALVAWGVAQWDYLLPETLTVEAGAANPATIWAVTVATILAVVLIFPAFALLYRLDQKGLLPEEGIAEPTA